MQSQEGTQSKTTKKRNRVKPGKEDSTKNGSTQQQIPSKSRRRRNAKKNKSKNQENIKPDLCPDVSVDKATNEEVPIPSAVIVEPPSIPTNLEVIVKDNMVQDKAANSSEKTREQIIAEREAKKLAKLQAKHKDKTAPPATPADNVPKQASESCTKVEKSREDVMAEREAKKLTKQAGKGKVTAQTATGLETKADEVASKLAATKIADDLDNDKKKPTLSKADRRAIQEAQRAAKAEKQNPQPAPMKSANVAAPKKDTKLSKPTHESARTDKSPSTPTKQRDSKFCKVKLFNHLDCSSRENNIFVNNAQIHPIMVRLGEQYSKRTIVGSNARCISFLNALKTVIQEYETPPKKEFARSLETTIKHCVDHLHKCRPLAVSVNNAFKHIKYVLTQLPTDQPESELKEHLCHFIDTYIENQIGKAAEAISSSVQQKISNGDVILTFGCSSLINYIFEEAHRRHVDFRVIVVDSRPFSEGQELLRRLVSKEIPCTYVLINAVGFIMPEVTKVLLGAHSLLANGYVMARTGTAQVALVARSFNVPVLVCCETHKFSERVQTDAIVYNELGNPDDLVLSKNCRLANWQSQNKLLPLNLNFDITPPELVTAVVTEVAILPCTSVPVILRIKPTEIGY